MPLKRHNHAFDRLQQAERQDQHQRQPDRRVHPVGRRPGQLDVESQRHDHMPDQHDDEISGKVVGAMMMKGLAAGVACVGDLHETAKQMAPSAGRASAA